MYTIYGIKNCDTVKKTINWFKEHDLPFSFHDYKLEAVDKKLLADWTGQVGLEVLLNKKSTTWRELDEVTQKSASKDKGAIALMSSKNTLIKRPVILKQGKVMAVGFNETEYREKFGKKR